MIILTKSSLPVKASSKNSFVEKLSSLGKDLRKTKYLQLMIIPGLIYYIIFHYIPMYGITIAFKDFNLRLGVFGSPWVGFKHFESFFRHPYFWRLIKNTFLLNLLNLVFGFPAPIILAIFLNEVRNSFYKKFVQTVSYLPHFISTVSLAGILYLLLSPYSGFVNRLITNLTGHEAIYFMAEPKWFRTIYVASGIWQSVGWNSIIYLAALSDVNMELYDSATVDGANRWRQIWHISLPSIAPTIIILLILNIGSMMSSSTDKVLLLQSPATYEVSDVIGTYVYRRGLVLAEYGFGTAVGLFNSVINLTLILISNAISKKVTDQGLW